MSVNQAIESQQNTCVMLAPASATVGKNVTDAVQAGGWKLQRTDSAVGAMVTLCNLECERRVTSGSNAASPHMLLIHREFDNAERLLLVAALRRHMPGLRIHEVLPPDANAAAHSVSGVVQRVSDVVGRIGHHVERPLPRPQPQPGARGKAELQSPSGANEHDAGRAAAPTHQVSRAEISMLLSEEEIAGILRHAVALPDGSEEAK